MTVVKSAAYFIGAVVSFGYVPMLLDGFKYGCMAINYIDGVLNNP